MSITVVSDSDTGRKSITVVGELVTYDFEGGFGPDEIKVGEIDISDIIARLFDLTLTPRGSLGSHQQLGRVELTIECE